MAQPKSKNNAPVFKAQPLSPDHPLDDDTPLNVYVVARSMLGLIQRITDLAKHESKTVPSQTGYYPITLLANAKGEVLCADGVPVVVRAPLDVLAIAPDGIDDQGGRA